MFDHIPNVNLHNTGPKLLYMQFIALNSTMLVLCMELLSGRTFLLNFYQN